MLHSSIQLNRENQQGIEGNKLLKKVKEFMVSIDESISDLNSSLAQQTEILRQLIGSVTSNNQFLRGVCEEPMNIPRLFILLPSISNTASMTNTIRWLTTTHFKLFFVCPVTGKPCATNEGKGYDLELPQGWIQSYGPAIKQSLSYLGFFSEIGSKIMKCDDSGLPIINSLNKELDHAMEASSFGEFLKELNSSTEGAPVSNVDDVIALDLEPDELTGASYRALNAELRRKDPGMVHCGLEWVQSENLGDDTFVTWVSKEGKDRFLKGGKKALLLHGKSKV